LLCASALAERSLIAGERGDHAAAEAFAGRASEIVEESGLQSYPTRGGVLAHRREPRCATAAGTRRAPSSPLRRTSSPSSRARSRGSQSRSGSSSAAHTLRCATPAAARRLLGEAQELLVGRELGTLAGQATELAAELAELDRGASSGSSLTAAELRLLPLLATHLSFREIGERLFVSRNTIKTQAISVYRKLGVSTRSAAIARAQQLGLVEAGRPPARSPSRDDVCRLPRQ
jgi:LuxR family maltose regulon positive regulatory protein